MPELFPTECKCLPRRLFSLSQLRRRGTLLCGKLAGPIRLLGQLISLSMDIVTVKNYSCFRTDTFLVPTPDLFPNNDREAKGK